MIKNKELIKENKRHIKIDKEEDIEQDIVEEEKKV